MQTMTDPAPIPPRLSPAAARAQLLAIIDGPGIAPQAKNFTKQLVHLDQWPPADPGEVAIECLVPDTAPDSDDAQPSEMTRMAKIMIALVAHRAFEAGRASLPIPDVTSSTTTRAKDLLRVVGSCLRLGSALDEDAVLPSLEDALRPYIENEARMARTIGRLRDCLYPGGTGAVEHGADDLGTVNNILIEMGYGPSDGRDGPDDVDPDDGEDEAG